MKTIPQIRTELLEIGKALRNDEGEMDYDSYSSYANRIIRLANLTKRRKAVRRAGAEHAAFTPEIARRIRSWARNHRNESYAKMGLRFNVSIGRISEALVGKRAA